MNIIFIRVFLIQNIEIKFKKKQQNINYIKYNTIEIQDRMKDQRIYQVNLVIALLFVLLIKSQAQYFYCYPNQTFVIFRGCVNACSANCLTCIDKTAAGCKSCTSSYELTNQTVGCVLKCLVNQTRISGICQISCSANCLTCIDKTAAGCRSCTSSYELTNQTVGCVLKCLANQTRISGICQISCSANCLTCIDKTAAGCRSCTSSYELTNQTVGCVLKCLANQTRISGICQISCSANCIACINTTEAGCSSCATGYQLGPSGGCIPTCDTLGNCLPVCSLNCQSCVNSTAQGCTLCLPGFQIYDQALGCTFECLLNQTFSNGTCLENCSTYCTNCLNTTSSGCISCQSGYLLSSNGTGCMKQCLSNQTLLNGNCVANCSINCFTCINITLQGCTQCEPNYELLSGQCLIECLANETRVNKSCQINCSQNCNECYDKTSQGCTSCKEGYKLSINSCIPKCQSNQIETQNGKCYGTIVEQQTVKTAVGVLTVPNINSLVTSFSFLLLVADKLWFYQYHNRGYEDKMISVFEIVRSLQNTKFTPLNSDSLVKNIPKIQSFNFTNYQFYTDPAYLKLEGIDGKLMHNLKYYFFIGIPTSAAIYLVLRFIFFLLFNYKISIYLRRFAFIGTLLITIIEPNIQYVSFLSMNEMKSMLFSQNFAQKLAAVSFIIVFCVFILYASCFYLMVNYFYAKLAKYFILNCYRINQTSIWLTGQIGIKNVMLGFVHCFLFSYYQIQIRCLIFIQIFFLCFTIYIWKGYDIFMNKSTVCCRILNSLFFILLQMTFLSQYYATSSQLRILYDQISEVLIYFMIISAIMYILFDIIVPIIQKCLSTPEQTQEQSERRQLESLQNHERINHQNQSQSKISQIQQQNRIEQSSKQSQNVRNKIINRKSKSMQKYPALKILYTYNIKKNKKPQSSQSLQSEVQEIKLTKYQNKLINIDKQRFFQQNKLNQKMHSIGKQQKQQLSEYEEEPVDQLKSYHIIKKKNIIPKKHKKTFHQKEKKVRNQKEREKNQKEERLRFDNLAKSQKLMTNYNNLRIIYPTSKEEALEIQYINL